jgi:hypothetical protein
MSSDIIVELETKKIELSVATLNFKWMFASAWQSRMIGVTGSQVTLSPGRSPSLLPIHDTSFSTPNKPSLTFSALTFARLTLLPFFLAASLL